MTTARSMAFSRPIMIDISKDGTVSIRQRKAKSLAGTAIPVFSVDTVEEAMRLLTYLCTEQTGVHPWMPGERWYVFDDFTGVEDLPQITQQFVDAYQRLFSKPAVAA